MPREVNPELADRRTLGGKHPGGVAGRHPGAAKLGDGPLAPSAEKRLELPVDRLGRQRGLLTRRAHQRSPAPIPLPEPRSRRAPA